ncbi:TraG family conjugative transposon ATPase [Bacteroides reticulotermitis]|uniref:Conjugative transposon protein TraG n=2 Tax=Bacteroides reticulotermitis TaxID=1133319 RepID=W4UZ95_9BACE|nr:TraG family conjugative transposon ATPase [Bacteroides reticulotermitis]MBB4046410.1 conjugation system TraG family ATPase [Bacteroides reticulotermitis]GAE86580.1 conjugative transposon protein TraG [Bacteroides reticulotermitis JCM 10512]
MRNIMKASTIESKFPLLAVEHGCIISKDADITVAFRVDLPELFTVTSAEYEAIHAAWVKAVKVLPDYTVVHKQDWFVSEKYRPQTGDGDMSFLSRSYERHFNEHPFLSHSCYLFLTKTTKDRMRMQSNFSSLCRGNIIPKEVDKEMTVKFLESVGQFERIVDDSGFITLTRLTDDEITGTADSAGLIEKYFALSPEDTTTLEDLELGADGLRIGDKKVCLHTLSDAEDLPGRVGTSIRYEKLSTDRSDCLLSFASPVGLLLSCDHIFNQYLFLDDSAENLRKFEKQARNMQSLSRYSRGNQINKEWIDHYLNEAHSYGLTSIRAHFNVVAWSEDADKLQHIRNDVGSQLALMECRPRHNTVDAATLYWAGMPGNAGDFPAEESFYTFIEPALCFFTEETNYKDSPSPFGIKMCDRVSGKPLHLDISDLPMKKGIITNRNKFVLGPSGSGKSFFMNHMVRQYYEQGSHIVLVDTGNSYQGLCELIRRKTKGQDGIYFTYTEKSPISFNPFFTDDYVFETEKMDSIVTLLMTLWKSADEKAGKTESGELGNAVSGYIHLIQEDRSITPCFNTFYEYLKNDFREELNNREIAVEKEDFNISNLLTTLRPYYKGGRYDFLLNSADELDLLSKRFIVFEIDAIKDNKELFPVVTIIIMEAFINKMRRLKGVRKQLIVEEAWKALSSANMAEYLRYMYKTVRKYFGEAIVVTQEVDDIISSPVVKESIINNSDCKILLDQRKFMNRFDAIQSLLGLTDKERSQILSINMSNHPGRLYKEVWIGLGGVKSAVYATEVSMSEYLTYTTEESEKMEVMELAEKLGGDIELAIKQLAESKK